jgi:hypothetical protein
MFTQTVNGLKDINFYPLSMTVPDIITASSTQDSPGSFSFDLSTIPQTDCDDLLAAFQTWASSSIISLNLNCRAQREFLYQYPESADSVEYPPEITQSIGCARSSATTVLQLLRDLIPRSTVLKSLTLDWLDLALQDVREVIELLPQSTSLRVLKLDRAILRNEDLELLLQTVRPQQLEAIEIRDCEVDDEALESIEKYVEHGNVVSFVVDTEGFSEESREDVGQAVRTRIEAVQKENEKLRGTIRSLREYAKTQLDVNRTAAVGPGAEEFNRHLEELAQSKQFVAKS